MLLNRAMLLKVVKPPSVNICEYQVLYFRHNGLLSSKTLNPFYRQHVPMPGEYTNSKILSHPLDAGVLFDQLVK